MNRIELLVIDPQNDFNDPNGALYVPGGEEDMKRLAGMITRLKDKLADIHVTLDSHRKVDISHPMWWKDSGGKHPDPFTQVTAQDLKDGKWTTTQPGMFARSLEYLQTLEKSGRYPHVVWPYHCLIGDEGDGDFERTLGRLGTRFSQCSGSRGMPATMNSIASSPRATKAVSESRHSSLSSVRIRRAAASPSRSR